jgi:hypothetical protein
VDFFDRLQGTQVVTGIRFAEQVTQGVDVMDGDLHHKRAIKRGEERLGCTAGNAPLASGTHLELSSVICELLDPRSE